TRHVSDRRRRASGRCRPAGASPWRAARLLGLPPVRRATPAPFRSRWVAVLPRLREALLSLAPRPASGSSCGDVAPSARGRAWPAVADTAKAETLEPGLLQEARRRAYCNGARASGHARWYDPCARAPERTLAWAKIIATTARCWKSGSPVGQSSRSPS